MKLFYGDIEDGCGGNRDEETMRMKFETDSEVRGV